MSIKMLCDEHKEPAVFYSNQHERYMCFKCLMAQNKLLFIDKSYKDEMEEFIKIRELTYDAVEHNTQYCNLVSEWKNNVRNNLMKTKQVFNERIDSFIESFSERFRDIENAEIMQDKNGTTTFAA